MSLQKGSIVKFNKVPGPNTPGAPTKPYDLYSGIVVNDACKSGIMFEGEFWCDVMWTNNQVTRCYKKDLKVVNQDVDNFDCNHF